MENQTALLAELARLVRRYARSPYNSGQPIMQAMKKHHAMWADLLPMKNAADQFSDDLTAYSLRLAGLSVGALAKRMTFRLDLATAYELADAAVILAEGGAEMGSRDRLQSYVERVDSLDLDQRDADRNASG